MSKVSVMHKVAALLSILLMMTAFSSSPLSASPLLPSVLLNGDTLAKTCFDNNCTQQELTNGNSSTTSPDSTAQTTTVTSKVTSISARSESDVLPAGGSAPASFTSIATGEASVSYFFEIVGPQNTSVEALVAGTGNIAVTGNFASTGYGYLAEARLILPVAPVQDIFIEGGSGPIGPNQIQTMSNSFSIGGTFDFDTNTPYQVIMQVKTSTDLNEQSITTALADLIATASIDPSFQLLPFFANDYSIVFSDGIGDAAATTPLPATLPLFAGGLGFLGYLTRRKRSAKQALAAS